MEGEPIHATHAQLAAGSTGGSDVDLQRRASSSTDPRVPIVKEPVREAYLQPSFDSGVEGRIETSSGGGPLLSFLKGPRGSTSSLAKSTISSASQTGKKKMKKLFAIFTRNEGKSRDAR